MPVFAIALVVVRAMGVIELVRAAVALIYTAIRFAFLIGEAQGSVWLNKVELSSWLSPIDVLTVGVVLLLVSKPLARVASSFAAHSDIASQF
jgi:hypothetical protein